ncbi:NAD(P)-binding protein [Aureobasidium sp. EXF-12298]|nr:NAD(P)-binding protein [Aureobasidium sp. EXF-12298]KAI4766924.1 NAD(P)-binding protein [Aureobasidium sp. EXF-12344]KAI4778139.1 NAD(P)-binding protein [Aureobasidium sp. EXF-3400]
MAASRDYPSPSTAISGLTLPSTCDPPGEDNPPVQKTWIVFGATGHMGRSIVKTCLSHGDKVTAVGRVGEHTLDQMQGWHESCLGLLCDVRVSKTVDSVIQNTIRHFGAVDVIVNCTGYGVIGACEDQDVCDLRAQFETNFFGCLNIVQQSLPYFRKRNAGRYLIFSSTSGALGVPGLGPYCATKYAVEGLIESLLYEVDAFNIKATLVAPGHLRLDEPTGLDDKGSDSADKSRLPTYGHFLVKSPSQPYESQNAPAAHAKRVVQWLSNKQPTSAVKSAELTWQLGHCSFPPLRLLLGSFAVESIRDRLRCIIEESSVQIEDWKHLSFPRADDRDQQTPQPAGEDSTSQHQLTPGDEIAEVADGDMEIDEG